MRSTVVKVASAFGVMAALVVTVAPSGAAQVARSQPNDFVVGGGQHLTDLSFGISAHSGPLGEDPKGALTGQPATQGEAAFHAEVTCVIVSGNQAFVTGILNQPESSRGQTMGCACSRQRQKPRFGITGPSPVLIRGRNYPCCRKPGVLHFVSSPGTSYEGRPPGERRHAVTRELFRKGG
jgi:hypothetical protein